ncbi:non-ribosomal peptide synthetase [Niveibacterium sp. COAC-50]|uniref:non-ribosomal peptide synthetase n=1 Tax=Niveibacterium sp. COAC-50 TaxID=2729384 RepID=UPI001554C917|nr:non-ribosomal peptide synthetase [Niveibacterium sp. COAC-50]
MGSPELRAVVQGLLPLSLSQHEVWLDQRAWPGSPHLIIGGGILFKGRLDRLLLQAALDRTVAECEVLRLVPQAAGGQQLLAAHQQALVFAEIAANLPMREAVQRWWNASLATPFALDGPPPWRIALLSAGEAEHCVVIQFHHLVMDGWGTTQIMARWAAHYAALVAGDAQPAAEDGDYRCFIDESLAYRASQDFADDGAFWAAQLPSLPPPLFERHSAARADHHTRLPAATLSRLPLPRTDYQQIVAAANAPGQSAFCVFLAALALYFCRVRGLSEIVVGVPSLNRNGKRHKRTPGMFVGVLPLRINVTPEDTVASLIAGISRTLRSALRHARYPLSEVARQLQAIRSHRDSVFDVLLSFERQDYSVRFGEACAVDSWQLFSGVARYPLGLTVCEFDDSGDLELVLEGSSACFAEGELALLGRRIRHVMCEIARQTSLPVAAIDILPPNERAAVLDGVHRGLLETVSPASFIAQFETQARQAPDARALVWDGGSLSYGQLNLHAQALATRLRGAGAARNLIVAVCMRRSADMVVALLAIAKAGAAFLPLDVDAPDARLAVVLQESQAVAVLVDPAERPRIAALHPQPIALGPLPSSPGNNAAPTWPAPAQDDLAYVLFTSGSTGRPKGVMIEHGALARRIAWLAREWAIGPTDRSAQATQITFDPALIELILPLACGASVALPPPGRLAPEAVAEFSARHGVTFTSFVPSTLRRFVDAAGGMPRLQLRVACCGGDVLPPALAQRFRETCGARLYNVYGPTEACIFATAWPCSASDGDGALPVGRPVDDTRIYVLDDAGRPAPFGCQGDIWIGGNTIARGYLNRPDLDADAFAADPFRTAGRMYRTGDRGWLTTDGTLHFAGRSDRQIKLRGYRIEPAEIEAALLAVGGVNQAAVRLVDADHKPRLHAWVAADGQDTAALNRHLRSHLPDYMLPAGITILATLPLNSTGKVDYAALPEPASPNHGDTTRQPRTALERDLLGLWEAGLKMHSIGIDDDFFELGGDSLAAVDILAGVQRLTGKSASLLMLTENPSVALLAEALQDEAGPTRLMLPLGQQSGRITLYVAASGHGDLMRMQALARALGPEINLFMLQPPTSGKLADMADLAAQYADKIAQHARQPVMLAGFSVGGIAALETARTLQARGVTVRGLVLIDTVYPGPLLRRPRFWRLLAWLTRSLYVQELSMNGRRLGAMFADTGLVAQVMALHDYRPQAFAGRSCLIKSSGLANWDRWLFRPWLRLGQGALATREIAGLHGSVFEVGHVEALAAALRAELGEPD